MNVYFIEAKYPREKDPFTKIGKARDPEQRMADLQVGSPCEWFRLRRIDRAALHRVIAQLNVGYEESRRADQVNAAFDAEFRAILG